MPADPAALRANAVQSRVPGLGASKALLRLDAALRLGPVAVGAWLGHRLSLTLGLPQRRLADTLIPAGPFLPAMLPPRPAPALSRAAGALILGTAARLQGLPCPGPDAARHALDIDLFARGDVRAAWEPNRLAALPLLAQAARLDGGGAFLARAEALLIAWCAANPPYRGPNWACAQEAAFRALHLALALALLGSDAAPHAGARAFLALHARRIEATRLYARAQDNNHPVSEAAALYVIHLLLRDPDMAARAARDLGRVVARLVAPCGAFAQPSAQYHRLLLDTLAIAAFFARRLGGPPLPAVIGERAAAATQWLHRLVDPESGALPRIGHCDDSALADLSLCGPQDARGSVERAARIFCGASAGYAEDPGCLWLGLSCPARVLTREASWQSEGWRGWSAAGARGLLRGGSRLRFRPAHCDLLHFDLWDGALNILRDGGTGAYNPGPDAGHWPDALWGTAGHNTIAFDNTEQMPRAGRFLLARWPRSRSMPDGAAIRDHAGRVHERRVRVTGRVWTIEDRVAGRFATLALRWRLRPAPWRLTEDGAEGAAARIVVTADAPLAIALRPGLESLAYNQVSAAPVLELRAAAPVSRLVTTVLLPP